MATNLSFTQFRTWDKPVYLVYLIPCCSLASAKTRSMVFSGLVHPLADRCAAGFLCHFHILTPDVPGNSLNAGLVFCTKMSGRTVATDLWITFILPVTVTVCRAVFQHLVFRTQNTIIVLVIYVLPPFMPAFLRTPLREITSPDEIEQSFRLN